MKRVGPGTKRYQSHTFLKDQGRFQNGHTAVFQKPNILGRKKKPGIRLKVRLGWNYATKVCT